MQNIKKKLNKSNFIQTPTDAFSECKKSLNDLNNINKINQCKEVELSNALNDLQEIQQQLIKESDKTTYISNKDSVNYKSITDELLSHLKTLRYKIEKDS